MEAEKLSCESLEEAKGFVRRMVCPEAPFGRAFIEVEESLKQEAKTMILGKTVKAEKETLASCRPLPRGPRFGSWNRIDFGKPARA